MHRFVVVFAFCAAAACGDNHNGNTAPTVGDLSVTTDEDTPVMGALSVADPDGDDVSITVTQPAHGTVMMVSGSFTYTPAANYNGSDSFTVTVTDGTTQDTGTVSITVTPVNDAPTGVADSFATSEDAPHNAAISALLANDTDVDGDTLSVTAVGNPTNGTIALVGTNAVFTPTANFSGTGTYRYTVSDGQVTADVTVTVSIGGVNDPPVAVDDTATTAEDNNAVITGASLVANDTDSENQTLSVTAVANGTGGAVTLVGGDVTFTPSANFNGAATFTYTVSDGAGFDTGTVTVTVTGVNDDPVANADAVNTNEDIAVTVTQATMIANDTDVDTGDTLTVTAVSNAANGSVSLTGGDATFTPTGNLSGTGSYEYTVSDGAGGTATSTVTITITAVNDAPVAVDDVRLTDEDVTAIFASSALTTNDIDIEGDTLTVTSVSNAQNGSVALDVSGNITFTPTSNFNGNATFDYVVSDGNGGTDTGAVTMTVGPINDAPVANNDTASAQSGVATNYATSVFLTNDTDIENNTLTITGVANASDGASVSLAGTTITYTSAAAFTGPATFEYTVSDGAGGTATGVVTVNVFTANVCGDGVILGTETCDDNDTDPNDGCSATCAIEVGWSCTGAPSTCVPICGDNMTVGTEPCDDGNPTNGDGCDNNCTFTGCGNTIVTAGEACDDGDTDNTDGCTNDCNAGVVCNATQFAGGDRFSVDPVTGNCYVAFDSTAVTFFGAQTACVAMAGYLATVTSAGEQTLVAGVQNPTQNMWIGANDVATEGTFTWVTGEAFTFTNFAPTQPDDDVGLGGNGDCLHLFSAGAGPVSTWNDTNCNLDTFVEGHICEVELVPCGDGVVQAGEECEGGANCSATCQIIDGCGDGNIDPGEECDDDNQANNDGCSASCQIDDGCGDGNIDAGERCDDNNIASNDGCSATCALERMIFSEYVEGSSFNKALEIKNLTGGPVTLQGCTIGTTFNGGTAPTTFTFANAVIAANDVLVICDDAATLLTGLCDVTTNSVAMDFNGDDAIRLACDGTTFDIIGQIGFDPGTEWGTGVISTQDNTIRRKCAVTSGDTDGTDAFNPVTDWAGFVIDTFAGLGDPACVP